MNPFCSIVPFIFLSLVAFRRQLVNLASPALPGSRERRREEAEEALAEPLSGPGSALDLALMDVGDGAAIGASMIVVVLEGSLQQYH